MKNDTASSAVTGAGKLGVCLSLACAVHCMATPLLVAALPVFHLGFLLNENVEITLLLGAIVATGTSLGYGARRHGRWSLFVLLGLAGMLALVARKWATDDYEVVLMTAAAGLMVAGHFLNRHLCADCPQCQSSDRLDRTAATAAAQEGAATRCADTVMDDEAKGVIQVQNVTLGYARTAVLRDLNFSIRQGEFFGIVGANGSGKTTVLRALLGVLRPMSGVVTLPVADKLRFGYVPQRGTLDEIFPLTAREIVTMGCYGKLGPLGRMTMQRRERIERCLEQVGILEFADKPFRDLSGGQKQRALIARALAADANGLALDEPTDGMDLEGQRAIMELIGRLQREHGVTILYISHRLNELAGVADRLMLLHEGATRIGTVEEILTPQVLREVYGVDARVEQIGGKRVIIT